MQSWGRSSQTKSFNADTFDHIDQIQKTLKTLESTVAIGFDHIDQIKALLKLIVLRLACKFDVSSYN